MQTPDIVVRRQPQAAGSCPQGVDIFSKDWLFVPIHDHLHWSLVLVAHPGVPQGSDTDRERCIIRFDSLQGGA